MRIIQPTTGKGYWKAVAMLCIAVICYPFYLTAQVPEDINKIDRLIQGGKPDTATFNRLLTMGESFLDREGADPGDLQTSIYIARQMEGLGRRTNDSLGVGLSQLLLAKIYRETGKRDEGRIASVNAVRLLTLYGDSLQKARAILELGGTYTNNAPDMGDKIRLYKEGARIIATYGNKLDAAKLREFVGDLLQLNNQFAEAEIVLHEALNGYNEAGYGRLQGVYSLLGRTYTGLNNFTESLRYSLMALEIAEKLGDEGALTEAIYNSVGLNYYNVSYYDQAIEYFTKALTLAKKNSDTAAIKNMLLNIADAQCNLSQYQLSLQTLAEANRYPLAEDDFERLQVAMLAIKNYISLQEIDKAAPHFKRLKKYYDNGILSGSHRQSVLLSLTSYLQASGQFKETRGYLQTYHQGVRGSHLPLRKLAQGEYYSFKTDSALADYGSAIRHLQSFISLSDSLKSLQQSRQLGILQLQFQTERKDKNIELLTQKSQLQEVWLQNERILRNVSFAGVCMLLVCSALIYNRYRIKKKSALRLESQQNKINEQNRALTQLVEDKEWLLKEIHHRVKNNLQIVISLLNTQSRYLENDDAVAAIRNSQHRMYAMSLIHQRLYQTDSLDKINMNWYVRELISYMKESFDTGGNITFNEEIDEVTLDVIQAVPLGLILNEAVSNSIKYAFPSGRKGVISIGLRSGPGNLCQLYIRDNGVGFKGGHDPQLSDSLGMSLMQGLSDQLEGTFSLESSDNGVFIKVIFQCRSIEEKEITTDQ